MCIRPSGPSLPWHFDEAFELPDASRVAHVTKESILDLAGIEVGETVETRTPSLVSIDSTTKRFTKTNTQTGVGLTQTSSKKQTLVGLSFVVRSLKSI